jgi:DNA-binding CsgD family transcriptional regulator
VPPVPTYDPVTLIEAAYRIEVPVAEWLRELARCARRSLGAANLGAYALTYDASDVARFTCESFTHDGIRGAALLRFMRHEMPAAWRAEPAVVDAVFRHTPYGPSRRLPLAGAVDAARRHLSDLGAKDILGLNGVNVSGRGVHVGVLFSGHAPASIPVDVLARLSSHLAASYRLRERLGAAPAVERAEAILTPNGAVVHATAGAKLREARLALAGAAARVEALRQSAGRRDPERAVAQWKALVAARWSLVDHFDHDGKRYVLAERNDTESAPLAMLTGRERQVVALAAMGHANKMIGYELGISVSTAGVLLSRAARKLGVRSRAALIAAYEGGSKRAAKSA